MSSKKRKGTERIGTERGVKPPGKRRNGPDRTGPKAIETAERHARWIKMRRTMSYRQIAAEEGVSESTVHEAVSKALARVRDEPAAEQKAIELDCLNALLHSVWESAELGALDEVETARRVLADRRKLLGVDAPAKTMNVTPPPEELWATVRAWLAEPTPELEQALREAGWTRA